MNRICTVVFLLTFSLFLQAKGRDPGNFIPCFEKSPSYVQRMFGVWERKEGQKTRRGEHGIPWGAQFKKVTFSSDERVLNEFADIIITDNYCVYAAGAMETVRRSGKTSSYPFVMINVDDMPTIFWISGVKEGYKKMEAMGAELRITLMPKEDLLLLGGEFAEDKKITYQRAN